MIEKPFSRVISVIAAVSLIIMVGNAAGVEKNMPPACQQY